MTAYKYTTKYIKNVKQYINYALSIMHYALKCVPLHPLSA